MTAFPDQKPGFEISDPSARPVVELMKGNTSGADPDPPSEETPCETELFARKK